MAAKKAKVTRVRGGGDKSGQIGQRLKEIRRTLDLTLAVVEPAHRRVDLQSLEDRKTTRFPRLSTS